MKSKQSNTRWNRNKVTPDEIETKNHQMKSKQGNTRWNWSKVISYEIETK